MTTIVNLIGGPGIGKSTCASYLTSQLSMRGSKCEYVQEWVKNWAYEKRPIQWYDQFYITAQQFNSEVKYYGLVDYVVTDSPYLLGAYYAKYSNNFIIEDSIINLIYEFMYQMTKSGHKYINVILERQVPYNYVGRYQSESEAIAIDSYLEELITQGFFNYQTLHASPTVDSLNNIINQLWHGS
jgi:hypothetical protein